MLKDRNSTFFSHNFKKYQVSRPKKRKIFFPERLKSIHSILMRENYLIQLDDLLYSKFIITINPKGQKCLLISYQMQEYLISDTGKILMMLYTNLPKDNYSSINTMIECTFTGTRLILQDLLMWNNQDFMSKPVEDRLASLLDCFGLISQNSIQITVEEYYKCDADTFEHCYYCDREYLKDGILFYKTGKNYQHGITDYKFVWKDRYCAIIEDFDDKFEVSFGGELVTADGINVFQLNLQDKLKIGTNLGVNFRVSVQVLDIGSYKLEKIGELKETKGKASSWSEVVFNYKLRNEEICVESIFSILGKENIMKNSESSLFNSQEDLKYNEFDVSNDEDFFN